MVQEILDQAGGIPLVIATLGAQIGLVGNARDNLEVWKCAVDRFVNCLNSEPPSKPIAGITYSRNYWSAVKQSIDWLRQQEKHLFLLICMCRGPSVPEHILQFFCNITLEDCDLMTFLQWKDKLKSGHLVFEKDKELLSVHSSTKRLVHEYMQENLGSIVHSLVEKGPSSLRGVFESFSQNPRVIIALVCVYLDTTFGQPLALQIGLKSSTVDEDLITTIEPITKLFVRQVISRRNSTGELCMSAGEVKLLFQENIM